MTIKTKFDVGVYDCIVHIICCNNIRRSINYYCKKYDKKDSGIDEEPGAFFFRPGGKYGNYYIFFNIKNLTTNFVNHEKSHLTEEILRDRGIRPQGEARAFLDGFLSDKFQQFFEYQKNNLKFK